MNEDVITADLEKKLIRIIDKRILMYGVTSLLHFTASVASPFIVYDAYSKISDAYARKVILSTSAIILAYGVDCAIKNLKLTKFLLDRRNDFK